MDIYLNNTLAKKKEKFETLDGTSNVRMYTCGPTVYNYLHIGNLRSYVFADILKRVLYWNGYEVKQVMNVTDIGHLTSDADEGEDKMVKALKREGKAMSLESLNEIGHFYFDKAKADLDEMNVLPAYAYTFASDEILVQTELIEKLIDKGFVYKTLDGLYFDTEKLPSYGRLGGSASSDHSRIGVSEEKKNPRDFAVWKFADNEGIGFEAPFGKGFPGWHIECSAMAMKYLGEEFDIHTGGIDHISVHHNNEIAQSEAATGKLLARFWLHNNHLTIGEDKMAKSGENFLTLKVVKDKGISPLAYRYWLLTSRYSTRMDYSIEALQGAEAAFRKLKQFCADLPEGGAIDRNYKEKFKEAVNDDLDTAKGLAIIWELVKDDSISPADKKASLLSFDEVLGLSLGESGDAEIPEEVERLSKERISARGSNDFKRSDELREKIKDLGYEVLDTKEGQKLRKL